MPNLQYAIQVGWQTIRQEVWHQFAWCQVVHGQKTVDHCQNGWYACRLVHMFAIHSAEQVHHSPGADGQDMADRAIGHILQKDKTLLLLDQ